MKPGNAGRGKGPQVRSDAQREKGHGSGYVPITPNDDQKIRQHHMPK